MTEHAGDAKLLVYTSATRQYLSFLPLYTFFLSRSNPGTLFEYIVDDVDEAEREHGEALNWLRHNGAPVTLRAMSEYEGELPNHHSLRFILPSKNRAEYLYIGDIDVFVVEDILADHQSVFDAGLPYSNIIRPGTTRLGGVHLTKFDRYYPLPDLEPILETQTNDEAVLYHIVEAKGELKHQEAIDAIKPGRPLHGIHMSLNRIPFSAGKPKLNWGISWPHALATKAVIDGADFAAFSETLNEEARLLLANLVIVVEGITALGRDGFDKWTRRVRKALTPAPARDVVQPAPAPQPKTRFHRIYQENAQKGAVSKSGPSSNLPRTANLRAELPHLMQKLGVRTLLDLPCGDVFWMRHMLEDSDVAYIGGDIVEEIIEENRQTISRPNTTFEVMDLCTDKLPSADLLLCRDCLFLLSYEDISKALANIVTSDVEYVMLTTHKNHGFKNSDMPAGGWRWFDLFLPPFNFPSEPVARIEDGGGDRWMCVWKREALRDAVKAFSQSLQG